MLSKAASAIKDTSLKINRMMVDDESLVKDIDKNVEKNQQMLRQTVARIDKVLTQASNNVLCFTLMFFVMVLALLYKLTK